ncbi:hypothetical protein SAMN05216249_107103 [Acetitomaculum ruminis DSM 5522]|uniref:YlxR domain-containing protein n=1 Tax=Acetitomaculum ruminis DSM 5522 TaxID=1120918 RepID=A0A1I0XSF0_9FIRM|nr:hypothetical protein SAMN05216249_107103 [Acetitomaculum ruminis DSM 5522]
MPGKKKTPMRMCVGCGEMKNKKEMIRIIRNTENEIEIDASGKKNGRGAYICNNIECLRTAFKRKSLERSLKVSIPLELYEKLEKELKLSIER